MTFRFDLIDLRLFLNVVEAGSITGGAAATELSLASASARVLAMEHTLGLPLLLRSRQGVRPTPAGESLLLHARQLLRQLDQLHGVLGEFARGLTRQLRLLCDNAVLHAYLPERLSDFLAADPGLNLQLEELPGREIVAALAEGVAQVGIVREGTELFGLQSWAFVPDELVLVTPVGHALALAAAAGPVDLAQADGCDIVALPAGVALQDGWDHWVAQRGGRLNIRIRVSSLDAQCRLVASGAGVALLPHSAVLRHAQRLPIAVVPVTAPFKPYQLRLCVRRLDALPVVTQRLLTALLGPGVLLPATAPSPPGMPAP